MCVYIPHTHTTTQGLKRWAHCCALIEKAGLVIDHDQDPFNISLSFSPLFFSSYTQTLSLSLITTFTRFKFALTTAIPALQAGAAQPCIANKHPVSPTQGPQPH